MGLEAFCMTFTADDFFSCECYCGNSIADDAAANAEGCTMTCMGRPTEICGGSNRMNVFQAESSPAPSSSTSSSTSTTSHSTPATISSTTSLTSKPSFTTSSSIPASSTTSKPSTLTTTTRSFTASYMTPIPSTTATPTRGFYPLGCYAEPPAPTRKPMIQLLSSENMSPDLCISALLAADKPGTTYAVFGLEYGRECWAATSLVTSQTSLVGNMACDLACKGALDISCGGRGMYNYYIATSLRQSLTATSFPVRTSGTEGDWDAEVMP
ncbi:MAG: hypothetical protein LQ343_003407 [Gyalolechia ehrenbergii]|nr:MAG: hypothetical protein LQ343_003407 [Gyalolechia ehrenbergii]